MSRNFNGSSGLLDFGVADVLNPTVASTGIITTAAWIKPSTVVGRQRVAAYNDWSASSGLKGWAFGIEGDEVRFTKFGGVDITSSTFTITTTAWHFIAGAMTQGNSDLYWMTAAGSVTSFHSTSTAGMSFGTTHHCLIAGRSSGTSGGITDRFSGLIAEVAVWPNVKLTEAELVAYAYGGPWACGVKPSFYAPIWGVASPEPELTGLGVSGTLSGTAPVADHAPVGTRFPVAA